MMLYDPKWNVDVSSLETLIAWLKTRKGRYTYACHDGCMLAGYFRAHGYPDAELGSHTWHPYGERGKLYFGLPNHFAAIARERPHSYQAALKRAAFYLEEVRRGVKWE